MVIFENTADFRILVKNLQLSILLNGNNWIFLSKKLRRQMYDIVLTHSIWSSGVYPQPLRKRGVWGEWRKPWVSECAAIHWPCQRTQRDSDPGRQGEASPRVSAKHGEPSLESPAWVLTVCARPTLRCLRPEDCSTTLTAPIQIS